MKIKKIPMRSCCITHERLPKNDLIRIVRTPDGNVIIDKTGKANGHGAYLKSDLKVISKAKDSKELDKHLDTVVPDTIYSELELLISGDL